MKKLGLIFLLCLTACSPSLEDSKVIELVKLNYKQQSTTPGAGKWMLDSVEIVSKDRLPGDTARFLVVVYTRGLFRYPKIEDTPEGFLEKFHDTLQFEAESIGKMWKARRWMVIGASNE
jgi:hypothetical protein